MKNRTFHVKIKPFQVKIKTIQVKKFGHFIQQIICKSESLALKSLTSMRVSKQCQKKKIFFKLTYLEIEGAETTNQ